MLLEKSSVSLSGGKVMFNLRRRLDPCYEPRFSTLFTAGELATQPTDIPATEGKTKYPVILAYIKGAKFAGVLTAIIPFGGICA